MANIIYYYLNLIINMYILIAIYYYCIKIYGIRANIITSISLSSLMLTLIFTETYSVADLGSDLEIPHTTFLVNEAITIFLIFIIVFELARFSLKRSKGT
ncbi:MAG: hypothetical protein ACFFG0_21995, partial [Candidatus Thorarchaeota archaeon]